MPIDFTKPATSDNYSSAFVPNIVNAFNALGMWLDPALVGTVTSAPTGTKRLNESTGTLQRFNGTSWVDYAINKIAANASGNVTIAASSSGNTLTALGPAATTGYAFDALASGGAAAREVARFGHSGVSNGLQILSSGVAGGMTYAFAGGNVTIGAPSGGVPLTVAGQVATGNDGGTAGEVMVRQSYGSGILAMLGSEGSSGGPVLGCAVRPGASPGSFFSTVAFAYSRGAITIEGGSIRFRTSSIQTVAVDAAITLTERLAIGPDGNVTIAASSGGESLSIASAAGGLGASITGAAQPRLSLTTTGTVVNTVIASDVAGLGLAGTLTNHQFHLYTNALPRLIISAGGNFAINPPSGGGTPLVISVSTISTNGIDIASTAGRQASFGLLQSGQLGCSVYNPASTNELRFYVAGGDALIVNANRGISIPAPVGGVALSVAGAAVTPTNSQAFTATPTFNANLSNVFEFSGVMTANVTSCTISNPSNGQTISIRVKQDATGSRTFAAPAGAKITGSIQSTPSTASILTLTYSVMDARWEGSWMGLPV